jgi:hypothetical protein
MNEGLKGINFGEVDHFLYVRISSICADLGYVAREFIEEACCLFFDLVDEKGMTQFQLLSDEYQKYKEIRERTAYLPRMSEKKHAIVVNGIHEDIYEYLNCVRLENRMPWINLLKILLMLTELEMNKVDEKTWKAWLEEEDNKMIKDDFSNLISVLEGPHGFQIKKTRKRREFQKDLSIYPERAGFRYHSDRSDLFE